MSFAPHTQQMKTRSRYLRAQEARDDGFKWGGDARESGVGTETETETKTQTETQTGTETETETETTDTHARALTH